MDKKQRLRIYGKGRDRQYEKEIKELEKSNICEENKELIKKFKNHLFSKGCGESRVYKISYQLRNICEVLQKPLKGATKHDIEEVLTYYNSKEDYAEATKKDYMDRIKQFYRWFEDEDERIYSEELKTREKIRRFYKFISEIKTSVKLKKIDPETIITDEEVDKVIEKGAKTMKDKAFLKLLHETGMRCSEILSLRIKDIINNSNIARIKVPGTKTEERVIPVVHSLGYLHKWLEIHPKKDDKNSFLFVGESRRYGNKPLTRDGAQRLIDRCFERTGMKNKKHNFHWFRHSRASLLAPKLTEQILCKYMGWVLGSRQVRRYSHLSDNQLEDVYCKVNGIKKEDNKEEEKSLKKCVCGALNNYNANYCYKCGQALSIATVLEEENKDISEKENEFNEEMNKSIKLLMEIAQNPQFMDKFKEFVK